ncbi:phosphotransferase [Microlunatus parietis]|uniref:Aminoglycoside phosphotransferase (APT) family kinase protein n=1 Tax=Microlunatus parietis TaxID=682979 RepID=A0A7Y9I7J0_9ACTN|nr:phosphotransferase [Microlunatus parietis]NYE71558.1 aminoglycoside phosphotransferase (APT) family kinase protein [Microlunatus parietis]
MVEPAESPSLVRRLADRLGLTVERRLAGGEWGAYLVTGADGDRLVLKIMPRHGTGIFERVQLAVRLTDRLRRNGYPIPRLRDHGRWQDEVYTVQEFVDGEVCPRLTAAHVRQVYELWRRHRGAAAPHGADWPAEFAAQRATGRRLCDRLAGTRQESLARRITAILDTAETANLRTSDLEHHDFHYRNLMVDGSRLVAVFDWEGARPGDSRRDLLRMASTAIGIGRLEPEARDLLRDLVQQEVPADVRTALGASLALGDLGFGTYAGAEPPEWILRSCAYLLDDLVP